MALKLGQTAKDRITGIEGVVLGRAEYITGCNQVLVQPTAKKADGDVLESRWFDEQRMELVSTAPVVTLNNAVSPGPNKPAPRI